MWNLVNKSLVSFRMYEYISFAGYKKKSFGGKGVGGSLEGR